MSSLKPAIGITMGDAAGVGPEIIAMALAEHEIRDICNPVVIGDAAIIQQALQIIGSSAKVSGIKGIGEAQFANGTIEIVDLHNLSPRLVVKGQVSSLAGKAAFEYLRYAVDMALSGDIKAVVTAPLNKEALNEAGYSYPGHTEILAELCGAKQICMMLVVGDLRAAHISGHLSLKEACDSLSKERILAVIKLAVEAVKKMGIEEPRVAVAGLNPHAGEKGLFGKEEIVHILPAVEEARSSGVNIVGPIPPDTVFYRAKEGEFDLIIAMYHDQGHIPLKMTGFFEGVNITLGLPIVRTSVGHGTAFDKAGKGTASSKSLIRAIQLATQMAKSSI